MLNLMRSYNALVDTVRRSGHPVSLSLSLSLSLILNQNESASISISCSVPVLNALSICALQRCACFDLIRTLATAITSFLWCVCAMPRLHKGDRLTRVSSESAESRALRAYRIRYTVYWLDPIVQRVILIVHAAIRLGHIALRKRMDVILGVTRTQINY